MSVQDDIQNAILKNLSAEIGSALQAELKELKVLRENALSRDLSEKRQNKAIADKDEEIENLKRNAMSAADLQKREEAVLRREQQAELLAYKVTAADAAKQDIFKLVETVFKSPIYKQSLVGNIPIPISGSGGSVGFVSAHNPISTTTMTEPI